MGFDSWFTFLNLVVFSHLPGKPIYFQPKRTPGPSTRATYLVDFHLWFQNPFQSKSNRQSVRQRKMPRSWRSSWRRTRTRGVSAIGALLVFLFWLAGFGTLLKERDPTKRDKTASPKHWRSHRNLEDPPHKKPNGCCVI